MSYYQGQAADNLRQAKEIAEENGTWDQIQARHSEAQSTMECLAGCSDDMYQDVYDQSRDILADA